jgi:hypothetical protein
MEFEHIQSTDSSVSDNGIERIPSEYRNYCWQQTTIQDANHWQFYKQLASQVSYGGASSEAEAARLFGSEQIRHNLFFEHNSAHELATDLAEEIEQVFQNPTRPVTSQHNSTPEATIVELINYYFPEEQGLKNFELALAGELQENRFSQKPNSNAGFTNLKSALLAQDAIEPKEVTYPEPTKYNEEENANPSSPKKSFFGDGLFKQKTESLPGTSNNINAGEFNKERPRLKAYLKSRDYGQGSPDVPVQIQAIIDEFYPPNR